MQLPNMSTELAATPGKCVIEDAAEGDATWDLTVAKSDLEENLCKSSWFRV